jgi:steroid delta-isomerase-like uncharacterized protein
MTSRKHLSRTSLSMIALLVTSLVWAGGAGAQNAANDDDAAALDRHQRAVDAFNAQDPDAVVDLYAADAILHDPQSPEPIRGRDAIRESYAQMFETFPDAQVTILNRHVADGRMMYEIRLTGTNDGPIASLEGEIPATGRELDLRGAVFADLDDEGRFQETRRYMDIADMMGQLGLDGQD